MKQPVFTIGLTLLAVVFAIQNSESVRVSFLMWELNCSLALLIVLILLIGMMAGYFFHWSKAARRKRQTRNSQRENF